MTGRSAAPCQWDGADLILSVRVRPNAPRCDLALHGEVLRLSVQCPPLNDRANRQAIASLAETFGVPRRQVELLSGDHGRIKRFRIAQPQHFPAAIKTMLPTGK